MLRRAGLLLSVALIVAHGEAAQKPAPFVIDQSAPYAYIRFDHVGKRTPVIAGEPSSGYWLLLVNNCRIPLKLLVFDTGPENAGVGLYDEIIPASAGGISYFDNSGVLHGENAPQEKPPKGYRVDEVTSSTELRPGEHLLFSVPTNHVTEHWHLRVAFQLDPGKVPAELQPRTSVDFTWEMIPKASRAVDSSAANKP